MRIAGVEAPDSAVGEMALRLYRAGDINLALQLIQESEHLEFTAADCRRLVETIDTDPDGLAELADLRAVLARPALSAALTRGATKTASPPVMRDTEVVSD